MDVILVLFSLECLVGPVFSAPAEFYASKYDHVDIEAILNNRRFVTHYAACLLSKGPCTPDGVEFKSKNFSTYTHQDN